MNRNAIDIRTVLTAAAVVQSQGERRDGATWLDDIRLLEGIDGYSFTLSSGRVSIHIYFHNRYRVESPDREALERFYLKLASIAET